MGSGAIVRMPTDAKHKAAHCWRSVESCIPWLSDRKTIRMAHAPRERPRLERRENSAFDHGLPRIKDGNDVDASACELGLEASLEDLRGREASNKENRAGSIRVGNAIDVRAVHIDDLLQRRPEQLLGIRNDEVTTIEHHGR